jgi:hypothetical protein
MDVALQKSRMMATAYNEPYLQDVHVHQCGLDESLGTCICCQASCQMIYAKHKGTAAQHDSLLIINNNFTDAGAKHQ